MQPRSAADILASATLAPMKKTRKPSKANPLASDLGFSKFSASPSIPELTPRDANPLTTANPYIPPTSFTYTPTSTPDTFLTSRREEATGGSFDQTISFDNLESQPPVEKFDVPTAHDGPFKARQHLDAPKSREQRIQDALSILRDGRLSPFDIVLDILDNSKLGYWGYRNELFKQENENLPKMLQAIYSHEEGKERMNRWMLPHALEIITLIAMYGRLGNSLSLFSTNFQLSLSASSQSTPNISNHTPNILPSNTKPDALCLKAT